MELGLARREIEFLRRQGTASSESERRSVTPGVPPRVAISTIAELLNYFDGDSETYEQWERQVKLLQATYNLEDDMTRILIGSRLKKRAFNWFHSRAEHLEMSVNDLLDGLRKMYAHRLDRVAMRKQFEQRIWKRDEAFSDYLHNKIILANRVPIDEAEIVDYVIEGIPDSVLRDQIRIQRFNSATALLEAFKKITL